MIERNIYKEILHGIKTKPVTLITGARQVGKSTLCHKIEKELGFNYVSLDNNRIRNQALKDPALFLETYKAPLIIDEVQYVPELFEHLESIVNEAQHLGLDNKGMYVITGSQSYKLMEGVSESMSGRITIIEMSPLSMSEINNVKEEPFTVNVNKISERTKDYRIGVNELYEYITRGFYPELYLTRELDTEHFYSDYVSTYLERDVYKLYNIRNKIKFENFLEVLASLTGQELVYDNIAKIIGVDKVTIESWISILVAGNIVYLLEPYNEISIVKRIVKRPKIYFADTGLACYLAGLSDAEVLKKSYFAGAFLETYIINEIRKSYMNNSKKAKFNYYRDSNQNEIDLIILSKGIISFVECKKGISFESRDVKSFNQLDNTRYQIGDSCIICNTDVIYTIKNNVYALPITSI